jgi:ABC-2 type transport system permease protein
MYFKGLIGISETVSKRKKLTKEQFDKTVVMNSAVKSYAIKELRLLFRTPVYFINCVLMNLIWPFFLLIPVFTNSKGSFDLSDIKNLVNLGSYDGIILAVAFGAVLFASGTNAVTSTAISRDGESFFINRFIPVSYLDQIKGKTMAGLILGSVALLSMVIMLMVVAMPPIYMIILILIAGLLAVMFTSITGILIDLNFPKLHWDNEQKAVKQNMNVMVNMLIAIVAAAIVVIPTIILKLNIWIVFAALVVIFSFVNAVLYGFVKSEGVKLFENIEA